MGDYVYSELPHGWANTTLGVVVEPKMGKADPRSTPNAKFIGLEHIEAHTMKLLGTIPADSMKSSANVFRSGDVLYGRLRSYLNKVHQPSFKGLCSGEFIVMPESVAVSGKFLKYRLNAGDFVRFASRANTGDRPRVDFNQISSFGFLLPPKSEQTRIADTLDELFSDLNTGLAALERARDRLKLYRASVLKAAVEGALTADWREQHPDVEPADELLKRILVERRCRWEQDQLRKFEEKDKVPPKNWKAKYKEPVAPDTTNLPTLPEGWCWATVDQLSEIRSGQTPKGIPAISDELGTVVWFRVNDMNNPLNKCWMADGGLRMQSNLAEKLNLKLFPRDAIIFPKRGGAIKTNKKRLLAFPAACDLNIMALIPASEVSRYLWQWFQGLDLAKLSDGSNVPQINNPHIAPCLIPLAPLTEQEAIVAAVQAQLSAIDQLEADIDAKLQSAQALRQSILKHAFTGKLVPRDPDDEPASELLKRIAAERKARIQEVTAAKRKRAPSRRGRK